MAHKKMNYQVLETSVSFRGYFRIDKHKLRIELFEGGETEFEREVFERGHAVAVLPYDPQRDQVVLIEQFRVGAHCAGRDPWLMEPIAGIIEEGEQPEDVVAREAVEEANCSFGRLIPVFDYLVSPGACSETIKLYCGLCDTQNLGGVFGLPEEGENIKVHVLDRQQAYHYLQNGQAANAMTIIALQWLALNYEALQLEYA